MPCFVAPTATVELAGYPAKAYQILASTKLHIKLDSARISELPRANTLDCGFIGVDFGRVSSKIVVASYYASY